ncbi:MAG: hypothetical protein QF464_02145, partial [Myxococcota bacterium]|nr:hypothetical protein [Myxococcota bacterium]
AECDPCAPDDDACVAPGATTVCNAGGECVPGNPGSAGCDLCAGVQCPSTAAFCEDGWANSGSYSECNPQDGLCVQAPGLGPEDCGAQGLACVDGACVSLCADVNCTVEDTAHCEGDIAFTTNGVGYCDETTGECYWDVMQEEDCAADGLVCVDGACVDSDLCKDVVCETVDATCDGSIAVYGGVSTCNPETGECEFLTAEGPEDCAEIGLICLGGACVEDSCEPTETYYFLDSDGCHSCKCPASGIKSESACAITSDLSLCGGADLCAGVMCKPTLGWCDGDTAHAGSMTSCDPDTGACEPTALSIPKNCAATDEICFEGECVPPDTDLCALAECDGSPAYCDGDVANSAVTEDCDPATGECLPAPGLPPEDCAASGLTCADGACVYDPCHGLACGDLCDLCDPNDEDCLSIGAITTCDADGDCKPQDASVDPCEVTPTCSDDDCGPMPGMPNYTCPDGVTIGGPGPCELQASGACGWTIVQCPEDEDTCTPGESFEHADGCNNCICGDSGLKAEANCTKMACVCSGPADCTAGYFCDFPYDSCGAWGNGGVCAEKPETCVAGGPGACDCNGGSATNACELNAGGHDVLQYGGCSMDQDNTFVCGETTCDASLELCTISMNDIAGPMEPLFYNSCAPLPDGCDQGDCSCVATDDWMSCYGGSGHTMLFYPGG